MSNFPLAIRRKGAHNSKNIRVLAAQTPGKISIHAIDKSVKEVYTNMSNGEIIGCAGGSTDNKLRQLKADEQRSEQLLPNRWPLSYPYLYNVQTAQNFNTKTYKDTSRQPSGKCAIRKKFPLQKPSWGKLN